MIKILAIDDKSDNLTSLEAVINDSFPQARFYSATSGQLGVELAILHDPDVILLDVVMPKMDGFEVCRRLKMDPIVCDIPVVFLTATRAGKEGRLQALEVGAEAFLAKPIDEAELIAQITAMVKIKAANKHLRHEQDRLRLLVAERTNELELSQTATLNLLNDLKAENNARKNIEAELRKTQLLLQASLESPKDMIIMSVDKNYNYLYFNQAHAEAMKFAYGQDVEIGANVLNYISSEEDRKLSKKNYDIALSGQAHTSIEQYGDINRSFYESFYNPIFNEENEVFGIAIFARNITDRIKAEEALRLSENKFRKIYEEGPLCMAMLDVEGHFIAANTPFCEMIGYSEQELIQITFKEISDPSFLAENLENIRRLASGEITVYKTEKPYIRKDGRRIWASLSLTATFDNNGDLLYFLPLVEDITERKHSDELIKASEKRYQSLFEDSPTPMWEEDFSEVKIEIEKFRSSGVVNFKAFFKQHPDKVNELFSKIKIIDINKAVVSLHKARSKEEVLANYPGLLHESASEGLINEFALIAEGKTQFEIEIDAYTMKGETLQVILNWESVSSKETLSRVLISVTDITARIATERALKISEEKFRKAFESHPGLVGISRMTDGMYIDINDNFCETLGWPREEVIGKTSKEISVFFDYSQREQFVEVLKKNGSLHNFEINLKTKSGEKRIGLFSAEIIEIDGQSCLLAQIYDITDRKKTEEALRESEQLFSNMFYRSPVTIVITNPIDSRIIDVNDVFLVDMEYSRDEVIGRTTLELGMFDDPNERVKLIDELKVHNSVYGFECRFRSKSGKLLYGLMNVVFLQMKGMSCQLSTIIDITERRIAEEKIQDSLEKSDIAQEAAKIGFWDLDVRNYKLVWSKGLKAIFEIAPEEPTPTYEQFWDYIYPEDLQFVKECVDKQLEILAEKSIKYTYRIVTKGGILKHVEHIGRQNVSGDGQLLMIYGSLQDITEQKRAEMEITMLNEDLELRVAERTVQLQAANKEMEAFSYSVSHDLRAPLRAMDGFARILHEDYSSVLDEEGNRLLSVIMNNAQRMGHLIDDLLTFSHLNRLEINISKINMKEMAASVFKELVSNEVPDNLNFVLHDLPEANGDSAMVMQVWVNLIGNAIKFTSHKTERKIEVGYTIDNSECLYYVKDNGAGFDMNYANKLFGVFQRLHTTKEFEGTGVGLAIIKRIITRHNGRVWAEGEVDNGATFYFSLPNFNETARISIGEV